MFAVCVVVSLWAGVVVGNNASGEDNGLSQNESATVWSRDADTGVPENSQTGVEAVAAATDISFKRPPATAATWTRNDFTDLRPGGVRESVYPPHADTRNGTYIADAHATTFAVQPSTRAHIASGETPLYIAPNGTVRGLVDYRIRETMGNQSLSVVSHEVTAVRVLREGRVIDEVSDTQTPTLTYGELSGGPTTLTLEADIRVRVETTGGNESVETLTISDSQSVTVYDLDAVGSAATYPNGKTEIAVFQPLPWQGYVLDGMSDHRVRGVWRFYTARNPQWDRVVRANAGGTTVEHSDAHPVYVHAYPSRIGPRTQPVRDGPTLQRVWGIERRGAEETLGENISVEVVDGTYKTSYGVAVRTSSGSLDDVRVIGIVRGVTARVAESTNRTRIRESNLSVRVVEQDASEATVRIELYHDVGDPIVLADPERGSQPIRFDDRDGYITIAGQRVETNSSGVATVTLSQPGVYTVRYHPESWLTAEPAYASSTETIRWHPLSTRSGWWHLALTVSWNLIPFAVVYAAGRAFLNIFDIQRFL
ncbi:hypothetical protein [Halogranum gelatinilyticum]|uniref:hypothetical protein n=1 Tax=Halogranum gelatinilyticum TaxID=660521 RepID=UPI001FCDEB37|nr:hypothetical protein [Halogranum gelatinilyticum]